MSAAQPGCLRVGREAVLLDHRTHALDRAAADALLFGFSIDDIAGSRYGNTCQLSDITEFHAEYSLFFVVHVDILANPNR